MKQSLLLLAICALAAFNGCTSASAPATATVVVPNVGTSWTFQNTYLDSSNNVKRTDTSTRVVVAKDTTVQGFSDVAMLVETFTTKTTPPDTVYIRYLSTGDISRLSWPLIAPHIAPEWLTIPYYKHKTEPYGWSGNFSLKGYTYDTISLTVSYLSQGSETVSGVTYSASAIIDTTWEHMTGAGKDSLIITSQTNSFLPSIGIFGNRGVNYKQINGKQVWREQQTLIAVTIK